jgi:hypothetical protein
MPRKVLFWSFLAVMDISLILEWMAVLFILPLGLNCHANSTVPSDAALALSMEQWVNGGVISVFVPWGMIVLLLCFSQQMGRRMGQTTLLLTVVSPMFLWHIFIVIWSILGLTLYNNVYSQLCAKSVGYDSIMMIGFYSEVIVSSTFVVFFTLAYICIIREDCRHRRAAAALLNPHPHRQEERAHLGQNNHGNAGGAQRRNPPRIVLLAREYMLAHIRFRD